PLRTAERFAAFPSADGRHLRPEAAHARIATPEQQPSHDSGDRVQRKCGYGAEPPGEHDGCGYFNEREREQPEKLAEVWIGWRRTRTAFGCLRLPRTFRRPSSALPARWH